MNFGVWMLGVHDRREEEVKISLPGMRLSGVLGRSIVPENVFEAGSWDDSGAKLPVTNRHLFTWLPIKNGRV
jgi:hypothetical protein